MVGKNAGGNYYRNSRGNINIPAGTGIPDSMDQRLRNGNLHRSHSVISDVESRSVDFKITKEVRSMSMETSTQQDTQHDPGMPLVDFNVYYYDWNKQKIERVSCARWG